MENALIVSDKSADLFKNLLLSITTCNINIAKSCSEARQKLAQTDFDYLIINSPLNDENGIELAQDMARKCCVILMVQTEYFDEISSTVEEYGVIALSKPTNKAIFWQALKVCKATQTRIKRIEKENNKLLQKIEDIKITDRAKFILISQFKMTENAAHKYIEKQAMDKRVTKRKVSEEILKTYET